MSYHAFLANTSGTVVGVWEPPNPTGVAVLVGRTPVGWYDPDPSGLPRALAAQGWAAVTVDTPAWGNQTDLDAIDTAIGFAAGHGLDTTTVLVVAHDRGGIAAANWAVRHPDRVAGLALVSPVVDLAEHWARVPTDRASMQAAHGGSQATFDAAMPTWNPVLPHPWGRRLREHVADRTTMWWAAAHTVTPAAVHAGLAAYYRCETGTLATPTSATAPHAEIAAQAVKQAGVWDQHAALVRWQAWAVARRDSATNEDWTGGDAHLSAQLADGSWVFSHADTTVGVVDPDETHAAPVIIRNNSLVRVTDDGTVGATIHHTGTSGVSVRPPDHPAAWYWPGQCLIDGSSVRLVALHATPPLTIDGVHVVTLDGASLAQTGTQTRPYRDGYNWGHNLVDDGTWTYILGGVPGEFLSDRCGIARCPTGGLLGAWEFWTGQGWGTDQDTLDGDARLRTVDGTEIEIGNPSLHRYPNGTWVLSGGPSAFAHQFDLFTSRQGPAAPNSWRHHDRITYPAKQPGGIAEDTDQSEFLFTYGANQHPRWRSAPDKVLISYALNGGGGLEFDSSFYQPRYLELTIPDLDDVAAGTVTATVTTAS